ncbi:E1 protein [Bos taurus papillomavirus 7]|uniref:Replication protein E1 n=1 Tax=Bos taurus papillomavirus 7 TaxID=1001533 RepID=Q30BJ1_9PAPI|nr:E1 protein [Bos taurus papillomavirus 7]ABB17198.1 E1 protein [Bos taurus papillomavirus 7]
MAEDKGTKGGGGMVSGSWYLDVEAECDEPDNLCDLEACFDKSDSDDDPEFISNSDVEEGNSSELLHNNHMLAKDGEQIQLLKRKYMSPSPDKELSPRLALVSISASHSSKRRLFPETKDKHEASNSSGSVSSTQVGSNSQSYNSEDLSIAILKSKNQKATALAQFKEAFGVSFTDLTRSFISNKTCTQHWVVAVFGPNSDILDGTGTLLEPHCTFLLKCTCFADRGPIILLLIEFKASKCRDTVQNLLNNIMRVEHHQMLLEPPKIRSQLTAFFFYKKTMAGGCDVIGKLPDWLTRLTVLSHQGATEAFELSRMVQWAYDNDMLEDSEIAYYYAQHADVDSNAAAWLKTNNQAKYVRDCGNMVRLYKQQEMKNLTMSEYIYKRCCKVEGSGDWKHIFKLLRYQDVNMIQFLTSFRDLLSCKPKRQCLVIYGPPDTGKSYFLYSLISFLKGKVISFTNSKSHFWLQPLLNAKVALLDDATKACWNYMDCYMRTALDGNAVSVDSKFKAPVQVRLPPLLISTNVELPLLEEYKYLHSRTMCYCFAKPCLYDDEGNPLFNLTDRHWKGFFLHLEQQLGLNFSEKDEEASGAFRCMPRTDAGID